MWEFPVFSSEKVSQAYQRNPFFHKKERKAFSFIWSWMTSVRFEPIYEIIFFIKNSSKLKSLNNRELYWFSRKKFKRKTKGFCWDCQSFEHPAFERESKSSDKKEKLLSILKVSEGMKRKPHLRYLSIKQSLRMQENFEAFSNKKKRGFVILFIDFCFHWLELLRIGHKMFL